MFHAQGQRWHASVETSPALTIALYLRDVCGLYPAGKPQLCSAAPRIKASDTTQLLSRLGGEPMLRFEWEQWWAQLLGSFPGRAPDLEPPDFDGFAGNPALQAVLHAHYGMAHEWATERDAAYREQARRRVEANTYQILNSIVAEREMELERDVKPFRLRLIELPLSAPRAWFLEPDTVLLADSLLDTEREFRSYLAPVVRFLA